MSTPRVAVAASGGRDSTALLHCTQRQAAALGLQVLALHVHHGLQPQADAWLRQVREQSRRWGAGFDCRHLAGSPLPGQSVEAWARAGRHAALAEMARAGGCTLLLLAHHRRDQAETWLLQALRGAGARGLASMPRCSDRQGLVWARPWLDVPRETIEAYVRRHRLRHVDDDSNDDIRFARNRLRREVWPALVGAFPDAEGALAAAAQRAQEAAALAAEVAAQDLPGLCLAGADAATGSAGPAPLSQAAWMVLPEARRRNALRAWLAPALAGGLPETLLARLMVELPRARSARWPAGAGELRLHRGALSLARRCGPAGAVRSSGPREPDALPSRDGPGDARPLTLDLSRPGRHRLPGWAGCLIVEATNEQGVAPAVLAAVLARPREGGERFRLSPGGAARSLKKQYQARQVPAWQREGPLLYAASGSLLYAPGLGVDAGQWQACGTSQLALRWVPATAAADAE